MNTILCIVMQPVSIGYLWLLNCLLTLHRMIPYGCLSTGDQISMIEVVLNSSTVAKIQKEKGGGAKVAFDKTTLYQFLKEHNSDSER